MKRKHLVISAVNLVEGGTLTVLRDCLASARRDLSADWDITAIVHKSDLIGIEGINYIERPEIKKSWFRRILFEYVESKKIAEDINPDYWLAMHDMSPRVGNVRQSVYCHNAMCFYSMSWKEMFYEPKLILFSWLYGLFYRINIHSNECVIVQQEWVRNEFFAKFNLNRIVVAHPLHENKSNVLLKKSGVRFFYPSFPRAFKNFETLLSAWEIIEKTDALDLHLTVTLNGNENRYSRHLVKKFQHLQSVDFVGIIPKSEMQEKYKNVDCVIFPSLLETWGLPLSEAKEHGLAIIAADLPYAHEAIGSYDAASFYSAKNANELAEKIIAFSKGELHFEKIISKDAQQPFKNNWKDLLSYIVN